MTEKTFATPCGTIRYWTNEKGDSPVSLVFLPGLTADHRLFERQIEYFEGKYHVLVWDAPAHASSWPFSFDFDLADKARWLDGIGILMIAWYGQFCIHKPQLTHLSSSM